MNLNRNLKTALILMGLVFNFSLTAHAGQESHGTSPAKRYMNCTEKGGRDRSFLLEMTIHDGTASFSQKNEAGEFDAIFENGTVKTEEDRIVISDKDKGKINWNLRENKKVCYKILDASHSLYLEKSGNGFVGSYQMYPNMHLNPALPGCSHPYLMRPPSVELECEYL